MTRNADAEGIAEFDRSLTVKFDWELTPFELRRELARREAKRVGALSGQADALDAMKMRRK